MRFLEIFEHNTRVSVPIQDVRAQQPIDLTSVVNHIKEIIGDTSDITIQSQSPIQDTIPPLYPDVIERTNLLTSIQTKLQSEGIVIIQGGTGKGKTTLAKSTAKTIRGSWLWLNLTKKDPSQVDQHLRQLAIAVSNRHYNDLLVIYS